MTLCDLHLASSLLIAFWIAFHRSTHRLTMFFSMTRCGLSYTCPIFYLPSLLLTIIEVIAMLFCYYK